MYDEERVDPANLFDLHGCVVLIVGPQADGPGGAIAHGLAASGARSAIGDIDSGRTHVAAAAINAHGRRSPNSTPFPSLVMGVENSCVEQSSI
jgi:NAD(P)-dependent dehydrogenase (short-subunit alcohol dehydrogenase family)